MANTECDENVTPEGQHFRAPYVADARRQDLENPTSFQCRRCDNRFMSQEMAILHDEMEHTRAPVHRQSTEASSKPSGEPVRSPGLRSIYQQTSALIANDVRRLLDRNHDIHAARSAYNLLLALEHLWQSAPSCAALLAKAIPQRSKLVELSSKLPCRQGPLWKALDSDDRSVLRMLRQAIFSEKEEIMRLRGDSAASFLTLVDLILYPSGLGQDLRFSQLLTAALDTGVQAFRSQLQRASVRLSMASFQLPEGLYLTGVALVDSEHVATGAYADVRMGRYLGRLVALKTMRVFSRQKPNELHKSQKTFCREISLLHGLDHQNICGLIGVDRALFGGRFCLVMDWMPHGNVIDFIRANSFVLGEVEQLVMEIGLALEYLHSKNVVHGDLHVRNILIDAGRHVRLADFGLSDFSDASSASVSSASIGAVRFMAPEILDPERFDLQRVQHTPKSDIHSFAMCVWTIFDGNAPFHDYLAVKATLAIIEGKRPSQHTAMHPLPSPLWSLLNLCWQEQPRDRPSSPDLCLRLQHIFNSPASALSTSRSKTKGLSSERSSPAPCLREDDSDNESTAGICNESDDGGLNPRQTLQRSRGVQSTRCTPVAKSNLLNIPLPSPVERPRTSPAVIQSSVPPTVRNLASVYPDAERLVPQIIYRPPQAQRLAGANASPIMFNVFGPQGCGVSCLDALNERFTELQDLDDIIECQRYMVLRIMWPDYEPWSVRILLDSNITRANLATRVSSCTQTFLDESLTKCLRPHTRWRLGPGAITLSDLQLVGLQPVAAQDWQVHYRVRQAAPLVA